MIDFDAQRRTFNAIRGIEDANARATAAAETCDLLREDIRRLRKELLITTSIATELFSALVHADSERAWQVSDSVLSDHREYRESCDFPDVRDLLSTFSRIR